MRQVVPKHQGLLSVGRLSPRAGLATVDAARCNQALERKEDQPDGHLPGALREQSTASSGYPLLSPPSHGASAERGTHLEPIRPCFLRLIDMAVLPLLPGTRAMYSTNGSCFRCVGFLGYDGGFDASAVRDDNDLASMAGAAIGEKTGRRAMRKKWKSRVAT